VCRTLHSGFVTYLASSRARSPARDTSWIYVMHGERDHCSVITFFEVFRGISSISSRSNPYLYRCIVTARGNILSLSELISRPPRPVILDLRPQALSRSSRSGSRLDTQVEQWTDGRTHQPSQAPQAQHVWPCLLRSLTPTCPLSAARVRMNHSHGCSPS
jgi:hypothetical protein